MWSMTTWIILTCIGVYVADEFLPMRLEMTGQFDPADLAHVDKNLLAYGNNGVHRAYVQDNSGKIMGVSDWIEVFEKSSGNHVGYAGVRQMKFLESFLYLSTDRLVNKVEYWRLIGFQFLHDHSQRVPWHLILNMMGLYFFGPIVEEYLKPKRYVAFFLVCGIFGAIMYVLLNLGGYIATLYGLGVHIPGLLFSDPTTPLVGASAGIFGVIMAGAYLAPNAMAYYLFIPMRLSTVAYVIVGLALFAVITGGNNAGGEASHLGGALAGWYFIRRSHHLHGFFDVLGRFDPTSRHYRNKRALSRPGTSDVDRLLDKVRDQGIESLTERERAILRQASQR